MKFEYIARTKEGEVQKGIVEASSNEAALQVLQQYNLFVTSLEVVKPKPIYARKISFFDKTSSKDIVVFSRQMAIMFKSQVPIVESLLVIAKQTAKTDFREKILKLSEEVEGGSPFSSALSLYPKIFSPFFISMIKSGEASGKLSEALEYLADHLEKEQAFKGKIRGAMVYPVFIFVVFLIVAILMIFFIIPPITEILKDSEQELPTITKIVIKLPDILQKWGWLMILAVVGLIMFAVRYLRTQEGKKTIDRISLKMPLIGSLLKKIYLSRFSENISTLISGGIPIARALEISADVIGNTVYKSIILKARDGVRRGEEISSVLKDYPEYVPPLVIQMAVVGEKTGSLGTSLLNVVNFYQKEVDSSIDSLISLLEPIMIIFLGLFTAGLLGAVLLPIYQMGNL